MRVFLGMILGALLTILGTYCYDSISTSPVASGPDAPATRTLVNWDVFREKWDALTVTARDGWHKLAARVER